MGISYSCITFNGDPILDALLGKAMASHEMIIDVIEAFGPCIYSFLGEVNELGAEPAPKSRLAVTAHAAGISLILDSISI